MRTVLFLALLALFAPQGLLALEFGLPEVAAGDYDDIVHDPRRAPFPGMPVVPLRASTFAHLPAGLNRTGGEVDMRRAAIGGGVIVPFAQELKLTFDIETEWTRYDFDSFGVFNDIYATRVRGTFRRRNGPDSELLFGLQLQSSLEAGAKFNESITWRLFGSAVVHIGDDVELRLGVALRNRLVDDPQIVPLIGLQWKLGEQWQLRIEEQRLELAFLPDEAWAVTLDVSGQFDTWRLQDRDGEQSSVFADQQIPVALGVRYQPGPGLRLQLRLGTATYREMVLWDAGGVEFSRTKVDPAPFIALQVRVALF